MDNPAELRIHSTNDVAPRGTAPTGSVAGEVWFSDVNEDVLPRAGVCEIGKNRVHFACDRRALNIKHGRKIDLVTPVIQADQVGSAVGFVETAIANLKPRFAGIKRGGASVIMRHVEHAE